MFPWIFTCVYLACVYFQCLLVFIIPYVYECEQNISKHLSIPNLTPKKIWTFYLINMVFKEMLGFMVLSQVLKGRTSSIIIEVWVGERSSQRARQGWLSPFFAWSWCPSCTLFLKLTCSKWNKLLWWHTWREKALSMFHLKICMGKRSQYPNMRYHGIFCDKKQMQDLKHICR